MRIVRESLYNFNKTGDVKSGLGLGGFSFETLYPGAIIKCIKTFGISDIKISKKFIQGKGLIDVESGGKIASPFGAKYRIYNDAEHLVMSVDKIKDSHLYRICILRFFKNPEYDNIRKAREIFISNKNLDKWGKYKLISPYREYFSQTITFYITKGKFDNRFIITERGEKI